VPMMRPSYGTAGTFHLLSTPAALTTPRRPQSGCDGLSHFKRTQVIPVYLPENLKSWHADRNIWWQCVHLCCSDVMPAAGRLLQQLSVWLRVWWEWLSHLPVPWAVQGSSTLYTEYVGQWRRSPSQTKKSDT